VNRLLELALAVPKGKALDVSQILGLSEDEIRIAEIIGEETEKERARQKGLIQEPVSVLGLGWNPYSHINSQNWDDLFVRPSIVSICSERTKISENKLIDFVLMKCNPNNWNAVLWMSIAYQNIEHAALMQIEKQMLQKSLEKRQAEEASKKARAAAEARHSKPGGSRDLQKKMQEAWASGKFGTREECAEQEYAAIGFRTIGAARRALQGTPDPDPSLWTGKKKRSSKRLG
jgi:hypothetical protein